MRSKRHGSRAAVVVLCLTAIGCGSASGGPKPTKNERPGRGGTLTVVAPASPPGLDPHRVPDVATAMAHGVLFRQLYVHVPEQAVAVPDLAAGPPELSDDRLTMTIPLKRTARFGPRDGRPIVAADIARGMERALADPVAGPRARRMLGAIDEIDPVREDRLVLRLSRPAPEEVAEGLATPASTPIPAELTEVAGPIPDDVPIFSGPYAPAPPADTEASAAPGTLILQRNPEWRRESDPRPAYADQIVFERAPRGPAAWGVLAGTGLVLAPSAPPEVARIAAKRHTGQVSVTPLPVTRYVGLNPRAAALRDVRVRQALVAGLDREAVLKAAGGGGTIASHYIPPGVPGHDESGGADGTGAPELREPSGDPQLAGTELRLAGSRDGRLDGTVLHAVRGDSGADAEVANAVRASWRHLGVRLRVKVVSQAEARSSCGERSGAVAVCLSAALGSSQGDPAALVSPVFGSHASRTLHDTIIAGAELPAGERRAQAWAQVNREAVRLAVGAPWRWDERALLVSRDVIGAVDDRAGAWDLAFTSLDARARARKK
ncbi:MAG: hypothetical protein JHC95_14960 [Solirubrobacteraceae bacterium]|nr:hypothetical protein [Solirubrobacteraceae bacterium]